jgi:hypothetical protein
LAALSIDSNFAVYDVGANRTTGYSFSLKSSDLTAPTRVFPTAAAEQEDHQKNNEYAISNLTFEVKSEDPCSNRPASPLRSIIKNERDGCLVTLSA